MYIWKIEDKYLQLKDAYFSWITDVPEEAKPWLDEYNVFYKKMKEYTRFGPVNIKCENLELYLGSNCSMNCEFCMTKAFYEYYNTSMDVDNFDIKACEHYMDVLMPDNIFFSGGEPPDYMDRVEQLIDLLKSKYDSKIKIILDTSGEHIDGIKRIKTLYPNTVISVTVELPKKGEVKNYRGQTFEELCDNLEQLSKDLNLTPADFNIKPYFSPGFDPDRYVYLHNKGFYHVETDVYHSMRPGRSFPSYTDDDLKNALSLCGKFESVYPGDKNPVYLLLTDSGNPCIKNISQFRQLEKGYVCRHDFDGTYTEGSIDNYCDNKFGIYKLALEYGEGYCCSRLKHPEQSDSATRVVRYMAAARVLSFLNSQKDNLDIFIDALNRDYAKRDKVLSKIRDKEDETGNIICHMCDVHYDATYNDILRYKHYLGLDDEKEIHFDNFLSINNYKDDQLLVLVKDYGYYRFLAIGLKKDLAKGKSKTYWYNDILRECLNEAV